MAQRLRFRDVKADCAAALNLCETDSRLAGKVNEVQERLLYERKYIGTLATYRVCLSHGCIVWPREIETVEAVHVDDYPYTIRDKWYEFLHSGPGGADDVTGPSSTLIDRGDVVAFDEVKGTDKQLAVYADKTETAKYITLQFYNDSGQWVRTQFNGAWIDGEKIAIPAAGSYAYTTNKCAAGGLVRVFKDQTDGGIRVYEYNKTNGALKALGYYQPDEEVPVYRASLIPGLTSDSDDCASKTVTVVAKRRYIPVKNDDDFILLSSRAAMRLACKALQKEDADKPEEAIKYWALCRKTLEDQVSHYLGSGVKRVFQTESSAIWGGGIESLR